MTETLLVEKYRPRRIEDCILPVDLQQIFMQMVKQNDIPNLLLSGRPGVGKTTVAKALVEEVGCDYIFIPASTRGNIDTLRNEVAQFASSISFTGKKKFVILDEVDAISASMATGLRNSFEEFSSNCGFILTCNHLGKIIPAIQSRCSTIEFKFSKSEYEKLAGRFFKRVCEILEKENITFDKKVIASYIQGYLKKNQLDFRKILNELQKYAVTGTIDPSILTASGSQSYDELVGYLKAKDFSNMRKWVALNSSGDPQTLLKEFYEYASEQFSPRYVPALILTIAEWSYKSAFMIDQEIALTAAFTLVMAEAEYK